MSSTEEKLEEAEYFLGLMKKDPLDHSKFKFHLSAFLSASRSITFIMQKEFKNKKFKDWYAKKQKEFDSNPLLAYFNNKRVISTHQEVIRPNKHVTIKLRDSLSINTQLGQVEIILNGKTRDSKIIESKKNVSRSGESHLKEPEILYRWFFDDKPEADLLSLCEEYVCYLRLLVRKGMEVNNM